MASNGLGPRWFPDWLREVLTDFASCFFEEASWERHDEGYERGFPAREVCDRKFLKAMLRDVSHASSTLKMAGSTVLAWLFWTMVRLFGWMTYQYKNRNL